MRLPASPAAKARQDDSLADGSANQPVDGEGRYRLVTTEKAGGVTYTPPRLATFVARQIVRSACRLPEGRPLRVLDPAVGDGELLYNLLGELECGQDSVEVSGFDIDSRALSLAERRLRARFPKVVLHLSAASFPDSLLENVPRTGQISLPYTADSMSYDLIIANPPYVRTQIMGTRRARSMARRFGLSGRVDLYYAFVIGISEVLSQSGVAGIIVSNRFMTTRSGAEVRRRLRERLAVHHVWDLGDTRLFDAAVLPAVVLLHGQARRLERPAGFTSAYETRETAEVTVSDPISALACSGVAEVPDGRRFAIRHGRLHASRSPGGVWRMATDTSDRWLEKVEQRTWARFGDIGKVRVGVKTCADSIFIRTDWDEMPGDFRPELLRPVTTHRVAGRFRPTREGQKRQILYPHETVRGVRRAVDLARYPRSAAYLEENRERLEARQYLAKAGRRWYEIWVPQDPAAWIQPKLVFRDIADRPAFWLDMDGTVVNGDCYWLTCEESDRLDLLWLAAAVGNSTFIERFYDLKFPNRLYASRRRFITQYVQEFPLPDPDLPESRRMVECARRIWKTTHSPTAAELEAELDEMVWCSLTGEPRPCSPCVGGGSSTGAQSASRPTAE